MKTVQTKHISDLAVVRAVATYNATYALSTPRMAFPYETLAEEFGCSQKVAYRACERACRHGLIEYGVSLRTGWLTEKGKELLHDECNTR